MKINGEGSESDRKATTHGQGERHQDTARNAQGGSR